MGKRSNFKRVPKDLYRTIDVRGGAAVLPFLRRDRIRTFVEPCWGWGDLTGQITRGGIRCVGRYDIDPKMTRKVDPELPGGQGHVIARDARQLTLADLNGADAIITNPPWARDLLHPMILRFAQLAPTWLLFDAAWKQTGQAARLMRICTDFVPCPRLKWIPHTRDSAMDDCGWYRFSLVDAEAGAGTRFWPLGATPDDAPSEILTQAIGA
ncbi:class I SAM-dependent methyltransferase [Labrenzia sp. R4_1]|uniref:class I SAM-dependent methyltransferase n=1 Tax=Labrenzia sp. R4_1 TaxID=2821106 RepID=UPI001ADAFDF5|nr:class I SAM-dependent methyltransferase [Labrenzia sp. R4_1]MBO9424666.1 class I SAM-dependent methyltransferase [Labrenzia sp. R4_1]